MIKKLLKWMYLLVSGACFIFVLVLIGCLSYLYLAEDSGKQIQALVQDYQDRQVHTPNYLLGDTPHSADDMTMAMASVSQPTKVGSTKGTDPKIKIDIKDGTAYLRPSEILYAETGENKLLHTTGERKIEMNYKQYSLEKLGDTLSQYQDFIVLRRYIINAAYIQQVKKNNKSKTIAILDNGKEIEIPAKQVKTIKSTLDEIHK